MKLLWSSRSPFVRKVMIVLAEKGMRDRVELVDAMVMLTAVPSDEVFAINPLGKIPALIRDDGETLFDSRVICEFLDREGEGDRLIPDGPEERLQCLRLQAAADGLLDILLLWRTEFGRGDNAHPGVLAGLEAKTRAVMALLDREADALRQLPFSFAHIAVACALGHLDFRYGNCNWRAEFKRLADLEADLVRRPSIAETAPVTDGSTGMGDIDMPLRFGGKT